MNAVKIIVALASFVVACGNKVEADPAPPAPTSIPTGAASSEVPAVVLRALPMPTRPQPPIPVIASGPLPSAAVSGVTSAAASSAP